VTEFRLLVGKTKGGSEYTDTTLKGSVTDHTVDGLPEDGSPVYARLSSLVDGKWQSADYSFLASSGAPARAARILAPAADSQLESSRVNFTWDEGSGVSEYMLYVGSTVGGTEFARINTGKRTSAAVANLPGNGQTLYVRLHSRIADRWVTSDAIYRSQDSRAKTFTLRVTNSLAYPVTVLVNEQAVMSVLAGRTGEQAIPRTGEVTVAWQLVRPSHPATGIPLGESLKAAFPAVVPGEEVSYEITNAVNGALYFTPVVTNASATEIFHVEVNPGTPTRAGLGAIAPGAAGLGLGYHRVQLTGSVRGYYGFGGYIGPFVEAPGVAGKLEPETGVVRVNLAVPASQ